MGLSAGNSAVDSRKCLKQLRHKHRAHIHGGLLSLNAWKITTLRNRDRTDPNYHADWSKYQAKSIKLGMNQFSPLFFQKAEASMDMVKGHEL
ncbi:hypothetical protein EMCRGX_G000062 [Ephydatia muelleri]